MKFEAAKLPPAESKPTKKLDVSFLPDFLTTFYSISQVYLALNIYYITLLGRIIQYYLSFKLFVLPK
ncbi:hypothetical protein D8M05_10305 [Oceanobacillus bengalensis]|uniref:Uncharacterized protein n=1 Tax=Oceanobacillus bengalensis TaxID=1435466 RepID=A0A494YYU2_9BACI|nr:hypothetical protein D8M05_10305 [Oceanobacillus bengalensis]